MAISNEDLKTFYSARRSDVLAENGGRRSNTQIISGAKNNQFTDLSDDQRRAGLQRARKETLVNHNADNIEGLSPWLALDKPTQYGDSAYFVITTADSFESDLTGVEPKYSAGLLTAEAVAGSITLVLEMEPGLASIFGDGDHIWVHTMDSISGAGEGTKERHIISGAPVVAAQQVTITLASALASTMPIGAKVCRIYRHHESLKPRSSLVSQSGAGTFDFSGYPPELTNRGTIRQRWTADYVSAGQVAVSGDELGSLGTFAITGDIAPINPASGQPYFTLPAGGHGAAHVAGDKLVFDTFGAELHYFIFNTVPVDTGPMGRQNISTSAGVESPL